MNENTNTTATVKVNKSKLIIAAFKTHGLETPANDIIDAIKQNDGVDVTVSLVNNIRHKVRAKRKDRAEKIRKTKRAKATTAPVQPVTTDLSKLLAVKKFAAEVGGVEALKGLIATLEQFQAELLAA